MAGAAEPLAAGAAAGPAFLIPGPAPAGRPFVTLSWAQTLDGSIAARRGERLRISGPESMAMTHALRSAHDAVLVGINTALADDPRLSVRLVQGPSPRPVALDSALRLPPSARLVAGAPLKPWVIYAAGAEGGDPAAGGSAGLEARRAALESAGCVCIEAGEGRRVDLGKALAALAARGVRSLMVEGGGLVLRSFVRAGFVDRYVVTIAPTIAYGYNPFSSSDGGPPSPLGGPSAPVALRQVAGLRYGDDLVVAAEPA